MEQIYTCIETCKSSIECSVSISMYSVIDLVRRFLSRHKKSQNSKVKIQKVNLLNFDF